MRAGRVMGQVYRRPAVRTVDGADLPPQFFDLVWGQRTQEVLLPEEVDEGDEAAVLARTSSILEPGRPLAIVHQLQRQHTPGAPSHGG